jgi:hypothetical protein
MTPRVGRIEIRRIGLAYDVMFAPRGNGEFRFKTEPGFRAFSGRSVSWSIGSKKLSMRFVATASMRFPMSC